MSERAGAENRWSLPEAPADVPPGPGEVGHDAPEVVALAFTVAPAVGGGSVGPVGRIIQTATASARLSSAKPFDLRPAGDRALALLATARRAVDEARAEGERIREEARREGLEVGRTEGLEAGRLEGIERGLAEAAEIRKTLAALIDDLKRHRAALKADAERHLTELAAAIAERVLRSHIDLDEGVVRRNVAAALELVTGADRLHILLAPEDVEAIKTFLPELAARSGAGGAAQTQSPEGLELVPDPNVTRGGCIIRTAGGQIDAQIETQLDEIQRQLQEQ